MNIIVCCKVVRDLDDVPAAEWSRAEDSTFEIDYTRKVWNFFDEAALETALCIKDETEGRGSSCDLTALTVVGSKERIDSFLIDLYAIQYGKIVK
ncbi:MAG: hypothetical protein LBS85_05795, partial [Clostridiales Family XIII bacterium]|nr:hypothetical protein [Clostridiales Family XIII bacterium]